MKSIKFFGNSLKCDYVRYLPSQISTINTTNSQIYIYIKIPKESSVISLLKSYLDLIFDVLHAATNDRYADNIDLRLVFLGQIASFSKYKLTTSSRKQLEDINHAHIVSLMYKLLTSARDTDDLSFGLHRGRNRGQRELTNNRNVEGRYHIRIKLKDVIAFAEHQEKSTYGMGYKLTLTRNVDNANLIKANATKIGKIKINAIEWYVPHYIPSIPQQAL